MKNILGIGWDNEEEILVPRDFDQNTYVRKFRERFLGKSFNVYRNWGFCGASGTAHWTNTVHKIDGEYFFEGATDSLIPGKKYTIKFYRIKVEELPSEDVIALLKEHGTLFVGMPGLMLAYELTNGEIVKEREDCLGIQERALSLNKSGRGIPTIDTWAFSTHAHHFYLGNKIEKSDLILCFTENG